MAKILSVCNRLQAGDYENGNGCKSTYTVYPRNASIIDVASLLRPAHHSTDHYIYHAGNPPHYFPSHFTSAASVSSFRSQLTTSVMSLHP